MTKSLKSKAIDIKGKKYVLVKDRVIAFNNEYANGKIETRLLSKPSAEMVVVKARVTPDVEIPERFFTGYSQARWGEGMVNETAALENAETSAVGRALAMMGIGVIDSVASVDEMNKANVRENASKSVKKAYNYEKTKSGISHDDCSVDHDNLPVLTVKKAGKNHGRRFRTCPDCKWFKWEKI